MKAGFSLLEVMIALVIVAIISMVAIPGYQHYIRKAHYAEIVQAASPYKLAVTECHHLTGDLKACSSGTNGLPIWQQQSSSLIKSIQVDSGVIKVVPEEKQGLKTSDTYILTPNIENDILTWKSSGGGVEAGYAR